MAGRKPEVDGLKANLLADFKSARSLVAVAQGLQGVRSGSSLKLHPKHVRRIVELAFMGAVSEWEDFLEGTFVRFLTGTKTSSGFQANLRAGKAQSIDHAYKLIAHDPNFSQSTGYLRFSDPRWTLMQAKFYFVNGKPFDCLDSKQQILKQANLVRNRVAHSSRKCKEDFKGVALQFISPNAQNLPHQSYRVGDLLLSQATRHFPNSIISRNVNHFEAFILLYEELASKIVP